MRDLPRTRVFAIVGGTMIALGLAACSSGTGYGTDTNAAPPAADQQSPAAAEVTPQVLKVAQLDGLAPIVVNGKGRTIYRFDKDSNNPPQSACAGDCAKTWEPVLAPNGFATETGVEKDLVGQITRTDGTKQLTLNGWPLYYFHKDLQLGQVAGQGVGNVWFAIAPSGAKAAGTGNGGGY